MILCQVEQEEQEASKEGEGKDRLKEGQANGPAGKGRENEAVPGQNTGNLTQKEGRATGELPTLL